MTMHGLKDQLVVVLRGSAWTKGSIGCFVAW